MKRTAKSRSQAKRVLTAATPACMTPSPEDITLAANYRAEQRGFTPGAELSDWLEAERELSQRASRS